MTQVRRKRRNTTILAMVLHKHVMTTCLNKSPKLERKLSFSVKISFLLRQGLSLFELLKIKPYDICNVTTLDIYSLLMLLVFARG